ncbi:hypothetical protein BMF94_6082 [Rhodotorula taiwanensis]|uniref:DUF1766-domain-containing protein n=1 Tax=Rhodotorula taiwanensis TaxID=741276 RepID=A0A2S5B299_9BASI|nr:hypothetical protein BMF94_6082 [Rhodotorula taiwanensis]
MPRHSISRDVPPPSSSQRTFPAASRNPLAPFPYPRPPSHSHSAPVLGRSPNGTPKCSQKQDSFSRERQTSGAASPALLASRSASGAENSAPLRKVRTASAPTTPQTQRPSRINSPSSPSTSARSSAGRKKAVSETRQCSGITATSKRCTRMVSLAAWQLSTAADGASSPIRPAQSASTPETDSEPVYCRQHAKLALADSGCFVVQRNLPTSNREHWVKFADWIDGTLPIETQTSLRHYMTAPISEHDTAGKSLQLMRSVSRYLYVYELVPRSPQSPPTSGSALAPTAHIKLGRTIKPVARLSQWRAMCPSREPIVRFVFPRPPTATETTSNMSPSGHAALRFADSGSTTHHRWERLCLVELAGRAIQGAQAERCTDCGSKHVECFVIERSAFGARGSGEWSIEQMVQKWERWCRDHAG